MSNANDTQVGGTHYRAHGKEIQHWDLAVMYQWDPFQYQITKYVMRWKYKYATPEERLKDLQKAAHFLQKYIESAAQYQPQAAPQPSTEVARDPLAGDDDFACEGYYGDNTPKSTSAATVARRCVLRAFGRPYRRTARAPGAVGTCTRVKPPTGPMGVNPYGQRLFLPLHWYCHAAIRNLPHATPLSAGGARAHHGGAAAHGTGCHV